MKLKVKPAIVGMFLIFLMFGSTIAYGVLQAVFYGPAQTTTTTLPDTNIVNYRLSQNQENLLLSQGKTLLLYFYNSTCSICIDQKQSLEQLVTSSKFSDQLFLEEILTNTNNANIPNLIVASYVGQKAINNITSDQITAVLCDLMVQPPVECALRKA